MESGYDNLHVRTLTAPSGVQHFVTFVLHAEVTGLVPPAGPAIAAAMVPAYLQLGKIRQLHLGPAVHQKARCYQ